MLGERWYVFAVHGRFEQKLFIVAARTIITQQLIFLGNLSVMSICEYYTKYFITTSAQN